MANYKKTTTELFNEIDENKCADAYLEANTEHFYNLSLSDFLKEMLEKYNMKKADLFRRAGLVGSNYAYEIFRDDKKTPSRDVILRLALAFPLNLEETQHALRCAGESPLYPRDKRDVYIIFALKNGQLPDALNDTLFEHGLNTLE